MLTEAQMRRSVEGKKRHPLTQFRPTEQWTHEECVNYEVARECIGTLIAFRSEWIYKEQKKQSPNFADIAQWDIEMSLYVQERRRLDMRDQENIARIRRDYGAEIRRLDAIEDGHSVG